MTPKLPYWSREWTISEDGDCARHSNGLVVTRAGSGFAVDPSSAEKLRQEMLRDLGSDWHHLAEIDELSGQAEYLLSRSQA